MALLLLSSAATVLSGEGQKEDPYESSWETEEGVDGIRVCAGDGGRYDSESVSGRGDDAGVVELGSEPKWSKLRDVEAIVGWLGR